jgi:cytochrome c oxidase subunit 4
VTDASHPQQPGQHGSAGHVSHKKTYIQIFIWLTVLTIAEVGVAVVFTHMKVPHFIIVTFLCLAAVVKAALVAMFFMHLRFERKTLALVVCAPLLLALILIIGLMPDSQSWFIHR